MFINTMDKLSRHMNDDFDMMIFDEEIINKSP